MEDHFKTELASQSKLAVLYKVIIVKKIILKVIVFLLYSTLMIAAKEHYRILFLNSLS